MMAPTMGTRTLPEIPSEIRALIRAQEWSRPTSGLAPGYVQANLVALPQELAFDFLIFCQRNPKPCPLLEVLEPGLFEPTQLAPGADLRTDIPRYQLLRNGQLASEEKEIQFLWREDLVSFLIGCSFTFEAALVKARIPMRHLEEGKNVPMYRTSIETVPAGAFSGPLVVSMRPIHRTQVVRAVQITSRFPSVHGAPVHVGDPGTIGIGDVSNPDYGDPVEIREGEVPVFWACGVTPQAVAMKSKPALMITHSPGHMFITDWRDEDLAIF